jgi:hypothetical protein
MLTEFVTYATSATLLLPGSRKGEWAVTVAVSCNLSDGVILGVDTAVTLPGSIVVRIEEGLP